MKLLATCMAILIPAASVVAASSTLEAYININLISETAMNLVVAKKDVDIGNLKVKLISCVATPNADHVMCEVTVENTAQNLGTIPPNDAKELVMPNKYSDQKTYFWARSYSVNINANNPEKSFVVEGMGVASR